MDHNSKQIKVRFFKEKFRTYLENSDSEESDIESDDEKKSPYPLIFNYLKSKNWVLEGDRNELEKELKVVLKGDLWSDDWMEKGPHGEGWYEDNWIIRHINGGYGEYVRN